MFPRPYAYFHFRNSIELEIALKRIHQILQRCAMIFFCKPPVRTMVGYFCLVLFPHFFLFSVLFSNRAASCLFYYFSRSEKELKIFSRLSIQISGIMWILHKDQPLIVNLSLVLSLLYVSLPIGFEKIKVIVNRKMCWSRKALMKKVLISN